MKFDPKIASVFLVFVVMLLNRRDFCCCFCLFLLVILLKRRLLSFVLFYEVVVISLVFVIVIVVHKCSYYIQLNWLCNFLNVSVLSRRSVVSYERATLLYIKVLLDAQFFLNLIENEQI